MQGFILSMKKIKNQDLILKLLTPLCVMDVYRFYGVRHSILALGKKIDFDLQKDGLFLPKLRNIIELGFPWESDYSRMYVWQLFIKLLASHLRDIDTLDCFYFDLLNEGASHLKKQNPMRVALEMEAKLLSHEGRTMQIQNPHCFVCDEVLNEEICLSRAFLLAHPHCIGGNRFKKAKILQFLFTHSSLYCEDEEIEKMWEIFSLGF